MSFSFNLDGLDINLQQERLTHGPSLSARDSSFQCTGSVLRGLIKVTFQTQGEGGGEVLLEPVCFEIKGSIEKWQTDILSFLYERSFSERGGNLEIFVNSNHIKDTLEVLNFTDCKEYLEHRLGLLAGSRQVDDDLFKIFQFKQPLIVARVIVGLLPSREEPKLFASCSLFPITIDSLESALKELKSQYGEKVTQFLGQGNIHPLASGRLRVLIKPVNDPTPISIFGDKSTHQLSPEWNDREIYLVYYPSERTTTATTYFCLEIVGGNSYPEESVETLKNLFGVSLIHLRTSAVDESGLRNPPFAACYRIIE